MHCCNQNIITTSFVENNLKSTSKKDHKEIKLVDFHVACCSVRCVCKSLSVSIPSATGKV